MKQEYITGITIGPITKLLGQARKTRELWAASYTLSLFAKIVLEELVVDKTIEILMPHTDIFKALSLPENNGVGIAPDRIVLKSTDNYLTKAKTATSEAIKKLAEIIAKHLIINKDLIVAELEDTLRIYAACVELKPETNILAELNTTLDQLELQCNYKQKDNNAYLLKFFTNVNKGKNNSFLTAYFKNFERNSDFNGHYRIPSVLEITTKPIFQKLPTEYKTIGNKYLWNDKDENDIDSKELEFFNEISNLKDSFNNNIFNKYHKYYALIYADGDKIGKYIKSLTSIDELVKLSKEFISSAQTGYQILLNYGALPLYIGGDDYLFLAPIVGNESNGLTKPTIANLCEAIRNNFKSHFEKISSEIDLTFAVSIHYYKFPLFEIMDNMYNLLRNVKDNVPGNGKFSIQLTHHSGNPISAVFQMDSEEFKTWNNIMNTMNESTINQNMLYKIREFESVWKETDHQGIINFFNDTMGLKYNDKNDRFTDTILLNNLKIDKPKKREIEVYNFHIKQMLCYHYPARNSVNTKPYNSLRIANFLKGFENV